MIEADELSDTVNVDLWSMYVSDQISDFLKSRQLVKSIHAANADDLLVLSCDLQVAYYHRDSIYL